MTEVIGVKFRTAGKVYYFSPKGVSFSRGEYAIVETSRGVEYGEVLLENQEITEDKIVAPLKDILRKATEEDRVQYEANHALEREAYETCQKKIKEHGLEMKLIDVEYTFDKGKALFYFTAEGRVDFRYGVCGRPLCCHSFLSEFAPVSIKMAKEQGLSLNPSSISGVCGRLMCCLKNEEEVYDFLNSKLPALGEFVTTREGLKGEVVSVSVLNQKVKLIVNLEKEDEKELREYSISDLKFKPRRKMDLE